MRILIVLALLSSAAHADPLRLNLIAAGTGVGQIDGVTGMAMQGSLELAFLVRHRSLFGLELGWGGICPPHDDRCSEIFDARIGLNARRRLGKTWFGGGVVAHQITHRASDAPIAARGQVDDTTVQWQPGADLQLGYELRKDHEPVGCHLGLRAFVIRDDSARLGKPVSQPPVVYGVDGGVVFEVGYIYGR